MWFQNDTRFKLFLGLKLIEIHQNPHVSCGLGKHYNFRLGPMLGKGKCEIHWILLVCITWIKNLDNQWEPCIEYE